MTELHRRDFVRISSLMTAIASSRHTATAGGASKSDSIAGQITPVAVIDDCCRLTAYSKTIRTRLKMLLDTEQEAVRAGGAVPDGERHVPVLLQSGEARKIGLALGWLLQKAADEKVKATGERAIYQDSEILRQIFLAQPWADESGLTEPAQKDVTDLFAVFVPRTLTVLHTFTPDREDLGNWIPRLVGWQRTMEERLNAYALAYRSPDPSKTKSHLANRNFYRPADPIIRLARAIQFGTAVNRGKWPRALQAAPTQSLYSQALERGTRYLEAASDYSARSISEAIFRDRTS